MNYRGNGSNLLSFADTITALDRDPLANVKYVYVEGAASPEGASDYIPAHIGQGFGVQGSGIPFLSGR